MGGVQKTVLRHDDIADLRLVTQEAEEEPIGEVAIRLVERFANGPVVVEPPVDVGRVEVPDSDRIRRRLVVFGEDVAVVEVLPASAPALLEDQQLRGIACAGEGREGRPGDADGPVAPVCVECVFRPAIADVGRRDRRELADLLVDTGIAQLLQCLVVETATDQSERAQQEPDEQ
jgi:hypothetical protein